MYGRLMNENIARSRTRGSPRWREKTMMIVVNQTYLYMSQYIVHNIHRLEFTCRETSKALRYTRKRPLYVDGRRSCMDSNNLVQSLQYTTKAW
jgi:hypothetical protein